jgi:hypothetical protein
MTKKFVRVVCNVACEWEGLPPIYRVYVNDELFTERTWIWKENFYLREEIQIEANPGEYAIHYELVPPNLAELLVTLPVVVSGPGSIDAQGLLRIENEIA